MKNILNKGILILFVLVGTMAQGQVKTILNNSAEVKGENPFLDASAFNNFDNNTGKGLVFPKTDLTKWTFITNSKDAIETKSNAFDGMIVYNTGSGKTIASQGKVIEVTPGFYYFSNSSPKGSIAQGEWKSIANGTKENAANTLLNGVVDPTNATGVDGDFYINTLTTSIFGPKKQGLWPEAVSLVGPSGLNGKTPEAIIVQGGPQFDFPGTQWNSHINFGENEDTYIRGGKDYSSVVLGDISGMLVGIGTSTPDVKLDVKGYGGKLIDFQTTGRARIMSNNAGLYLADASGYNKSFIGYESSFANHAFGIWADGSGWNFNMLQNGNVGIGTATPRTLLQIQGNTPIISLGTPERTGGAIELGNAAHGIKRVANDVITYTTAGSVKFSANGESSNHLVVNNNGNVGIGTAAPDATLHVARGTGVNGTAMFSGTQRSSHFNYSTNEDTYIRGGKNGSNVLINDYNGGNVGIGTNTPGAPLSINRDSGQSAMSILSMTSSNRFMSFFPNLAQGNYNYTVSSGDSGIIFSNDGNPSGDTNGFIIAPHSHHATGIKIMENGNVGIGTGNPQAKLDVNGHINAHSIYANNVLLRTGTYNLDLLNNGGNNTAFVQGEAFLRVIITTRDGSRPFQPDNSTGIAIISAGGEGIPAAHNVGRRLIVKLEIGPFPLNPISSQFDPNYYYSTFDNDLNFDSSSTYEFICMDIGGGNYKYLLLN